MQLWLSDAFTKISSSRHFFAKTISIYFVKFCNEITCTELENCIFLSQGPCVPKWWLDSENTSKSLWSDFRLAIRQFRVHAQIGSFFQACHKGSLAVKLSCIPVYRGSRRCSQREKLGSGTQRNLQILCTSRLGIFKKSHYRSGSLFLTHSILQGHLWPHKLIILTKHLMQFLFSTCCLNGSLCRARCKFGKAIMHRSSKLKN